MTEKSLPIILQDAEARQDARSRLDQNLILEAGAGTGKTTTLVARMMELICRQGVPIERIAAITFTEKATLEMVSRLGEELEKFVEENQKLTMEVNNAGIALAEFENNRISTIHSFARQILSGAPFEAGIDPAFTVIDDIEEKEIIDPLWETWIKEQLKDNDSPIRLGYVSGLANSDYRELFDLLYENRNLVKQNPTKESPLDGSAVLDCLEKQVEALEELANQHCSDPDDKGWDYIRKYRAYLNRILLAPPEACPGLIVRWNVTGMKAGVEKNWGGFKEQKKEMVQQLADEIESARHSFGRILFDGIVSRMTGFMDEVEREKRRLAVLSNDDLLIRAVDLLEKNRAVRERYKAEFSRILVDEFQDTDPLQVRLVFYLAEELDEFESSWEKVRTMKGKLFFVGDPKQSIYRFRRADIEIYQKVKEILGDDGFLAITVNFRCHEKIIQWVNQSFSRTITPPVDGDYQPDYIPLSPWGMIQGDYPLILLVEETLPEENRDTLGTCAQEAEAIAWQIRRMLVDTSYHPSSLGRSLKPSDIAILFPKYRYIPLYEEALLREEIPSRLYGGKLFYFRQEIRDILNCLKAIDNPRDQLSLVAVLKGPMFNLSDQELLEMKLEEVPLCYLAPFEGNHPGKEAYETLRLLHRERNRMNLGGLMEKMLTETGLLNFYSLLQKHGRARANIMKLLAMAREFENRPGGSLRRFIGYIQDAIADERAEPDAPAEEASRESVSLLTIHKAKGLEFPVVILAALCATDKPKKENLLIDTKTGILEASMHGFDTRKHSEQDELEKKKAEAENIRILYVAATRAKNTLIIPAYFKYGLSKDRRANPKFAHYQELLGPAITDENSSDRELFHIAEVSAGEVSPCIPLDVPPTIPSQDEPPAGILTKEMLEKLENEKKSANDKGSRHMKISSYTSDEEDSSTADSAYRKVQKRTGRAFHRVMEHIDLTGNEGWKNILDMAVTAEGVEENTQDVRIMVERTLKSGLVSRALSAGEYYREYPFILNRGDMTVRGVIDLLIREGDEYVIVDYKTDIADTAHQEILKNKYAAQAYTYKKAVEEMTSCPVKEVLFYMVRTGRAIPMDS